MREITGIDAASVTSMHCGGTIARIIEPENTGELVDSLGKHSGFVILGGGTNIIFRDGVVEIPVIRLSSGFESIDAEDTIVKAGAAARTSALVNFCRKRGLKGLEFLTGIPGTVGGALSMNAGTGSLGIMDRITSIELATSRGVVTVAKEELPCCYRDGGIPQGSVITSANFVLEQANPEEVDRGIREFSLRRKNQPSGYSSGCIFKNPPGASAGMLIDRAGLKGECSGGAHISEEHANFIINDGSAKVRDIESLIEKARGRVRQEFGTELVEEVRIVG